MARQTTDQLYIELDYYYPEEYYTYQAYAESALSCSSTIDCTISNVRGADLVAFSNAALTADAVVTRSAEVTLQATASIDQFVGNLYALRSASLSSEFAQTADANRLREPQIALNGEFTFNALISISGAVEGEGNWSSQFTVNVTPDLFKDMGANLYADAVCDPDGVQRIRDVDSTQSVEFTQTTNNYRIVQGNIAIDALFTPSMTVEAVRNAFAVLDSTSALAVVANANRSADIALSSIVNQSLQGDRFRDYVVNANSQFAITVTALRIKKSSVSVSSAFTATALVRRRAGLTTNASAQFTVSCIPKEIQGVIQLTLFNTASLTANVDAFIEPTVYLFNFTQVSTDQTPYGFYNSTYPKTAIRGYGGYDPNQIMSGRSYDTGVGEYYFDVRDINQDWERELTVNLPSNYQSISSRDFTIECLVYVNKSNIGTPYEPILTGSISRYDISLYPTNVVKFGNFYTSSNVGIGWHHLAYSRNGNTLRIFIDGTKVYEGSDTSTSSITSHVWGGYWGSGDSGGNQYTKLDEIRYTLDYSRYNANFIAPIFGTTFNWPGFEYAGAQLQSNFNINVIAYNVQFSGGALTSQASLNASVDKYRSGQAQFTSAFTETVTGRVSYDPTIGISSNFQETATPNKIVGVTANLSSAFTTTTTARKVNRTTALLTSQAVINSTVRKYSGNGASLFAVIATIVVNSRTRSTASTITAMASELAVVVKTGRGIIQCDLVTAQTTTPVKTARVTPTLTTVTTQVTDSVKTVRTGSTVEARATMVVDFRKFLAVEIYAQANSTQTTTTDDSKIVGVTANLTAQANQTAQAVKTARLSDTLAVLAQLTFGNQVTRLRRAESSQSALASLLAPAVKTARTNAELQAFDTVLAVGTKISFDPELQLTVPAEYAHVHVLEENTLLTVNPETRVNMVRMTI